MVFAAAVVGPGVGALGGENPEGFLAEHGRFVVVEDGAAAAVDDGVKFPIGARVADHGVFPTEATVREIAEHGWGGPVEGSGVPAVGAR